MYAFITILLSGSMTYCSPNLNELINMGRTLPEYQHAQAINYVVIGTHAINNFRKLEIRLFFSSVII
jgi:hypothetical protein